MINVGKNISSDIFAQCFWANSQVSWVCIARKVLYPLELFIVLHFGHRYHVNSKEDGINNVPISINNQNAMFTPPKKKRKMTLNHCFISIKELFWNESFWLP